MIVKRFGCTTIHNKALYKCIIHSFIHSFKCIIHSFIQYMECIHIKIIFKRPMDHILYIYILHCILQLMSMKEKAQVSVYSKMNGAGTKYKNE